MDWEMVKNMTDTTNLAYEYSRFEEKTKDEKPQIRQIKIKRKKVSVLKALSYMFVTLVLLSMLIYSQAMRVEIDAQNTKINAQIEEVKADNIRKQIKLSSSLSMKNIEELAKSDLGLEKQLDQQVDVIDFPIQNKSEVIKEQTVWDNVKSWFQKVF
ncbi:MAG: hypothetical protein RSA99_02120 [Oscillospiraceae bacterium]